MNNEFESEYNPTIEEVYTKMHYMNGVNYNMTIYDILSIDEFNHQIDRLIQASDIFVIVFSITRLSSYEMVSKIKNRIHNIKDAPYDSFIPILIVGGLIRK